MDPWLEAMRGGDYAAAWRICDAVLAERVDRAVDCTSWPRHLQFLWDGRPLGGCDVLVHCYHGLGDTLQFVRLLPRLRARARSTTLWVQPALLPLLRGCSGIDALRPLDDGPPPCGFDAHVELMELPHVLRLEASALPGPVPYVHVPAPPPRPASPDRLHVGLAWRAGGWDASRSIPPGLLAPLGRVRGVRWHALQWGEAPPDFATDEACAGLVEQARRLLALDLVVTVDTMTAHLAGAIGVRTWTLLPTPADWRWQVAGATSPWYPTMRLFRQPTPGDWRAVVDAVVRALDERGEEFTPSRAPPP